MTEKYVVFQFWYSLYQHIIILIDAKVDENQKFERFASKINRDD